MERRTTVEISGESYEAEYATISKAFIGFEDHGAFTAYLSFQGKSWSQSEAPRLWSPAQLDSYLQTVLKTLGVDDWSKVVGQEVLVLKRDYLGLILGFAHRTEDRYMFFESIVSGAPTPSSVEEAR